MSESYFSALRRVEDLLDALKTFDPGISDYDLDRIRINAENVFPEIFYGDSINSENDNTLKNFFNGLLFGYIIARTNHKKSPEEKFENET